MKKILLTAITLTCLLVGPSSVMACEPTSTPNDQGKNASVTWRVKLNEYGIKADSFDRIRNKTREIEGESPVEEQTGKAPEMESALKQESGEVKMAQVEPDQEVGVPDKGQETVPAEDREEDKAAALHAALNIVDHSGSNSQRKTGFALPCEIHIQEVMDLGAGAHLSATYGRIPFIDFSDGFRTSHEFQWIKSWDYENLAEMANFYGSTAGGSYMYLSDNLRNGAGALIGIYSGGINITNKVYNGKVVPVVITSYEDSVAGSKFPTVRSTRIGSKLFPILRKISFEQTGVGPHGLTSVTIPSSVFDRLDDKSTSPLIRRSGIRLPAGQMNRVIIRMGAIGEENAKNGLEYWLLRHSAADQLLTAELLPLVLPEAEIELVDRVRTNGITFVDFSRLIPKRLEKGIAENGLRNPRLCEVVYDQLLTAEPLPLVLPEEGRCAFVKSWSDGIILNNLAFYPITMISETYANAEERYRLIEIVTMN